MKKLLILFVLFLSINVFSQSSKTFYKNIELETILIKNVFDYKIDKNNYFVVKNSFRGCSEQVGGDHYKIFKAEGGYYKQSHLNEHGIIVITTIGAGQSVENSKFLAQQRCNLLAALSPD